MVSFGYGVGDVVTIGKLAWTVYKACKGIPASFGHIAQEVLALEAVVRQFQEAFEGHTLSDTEQERLRHVVQGCENVLTDLQNLVKKYEGLGSNAKFSFDRLKWATGFAPLDELRTRLISSTALLSAFAQTSPVVIKKHIRDVIRQLRDRKREGSILSGLSADSLTSDEQTQWRLIRKEFEGNGLTLSVLDKNRELIIEYLTAALGSVEMRTINNDTVKDGKGKDQVNQPFSVIDLDTTENPFLDSTFEVTTEIYDEVKEMASDEINIDARSEKEEANLASSNTHGGKQVLVPPRDSQPYFLRVLRKFSSLGTSYKPRKTTQKLQAIDHEIQRQIASQKSQEIDREIQRDRERRDREVKILLLGASEAGKTTLLKQMLSLDASHAPVTQQEEVRSTVYHNIVIGCRHAIEVMRDHKIRLDTSESESAASIVLNVSRNLDTSHFGNLSPKLYAAISTLRRDKAFVSTLHRSNEFAIYENMSYYLENLERISRGDYEPSLEDSLRSQLTTTGIAETLFEERSHNSKFHVFDVGGARSERRKWVHVFEGVQCLVFLAPINSYIRCLIEDKESNAMEESLMLFESLLKGPWFKKVRIILLLTKIDLLKDALRHHSIQHSWPDIDGDVQSERDVISFFTAKFLSYNTHTERRIEVKTMSIVDTESTHRFIKDELFKPRDQQ